MALTVSYVPGYTFTTGELITIAKLNLLANPTFNLEGSISSVAIGPGAVLTSNLADGVLSADATGLGKMADGYFAASAAARAKVAAGFFGTDATSYAFFADGFFKPFAPVVASVRNLIAQRASASTATITADEVVLKNTALSPYNAATVSLTVDITASGANGLDTGAEASSTWYYLWVIYNGTTVAGLLSASSTAPTLPGGYTHKALVGAVRNDGSSNFVVFYQHDRMVWINDTNIFTDKAAAGADTYESYQAGGGGSDVDLRTVVPPIAKRLSGTAGNSSGSNNHSMSVAADASGLGAGSCVAGSGLSVGLNGFTLSMPFLIPLKTSQTFFWKAINTTGRSRLNVAAYEI